MMVDNPRWEAEQQFLTRFKPVDLRTLEDGPPARHGHYVVMAQITNVYTANAEGFDVKVRDHTGAADFALRGLARYEFQGLHLPAPNPNDQVQDPFAISGTWFRSYLFKIHQDKRRANNGRNGIVVSRIAWDMDVIDVYAFNRLSVQETKLFLDAVLDMVPSGPGYPRDGLDISPNKAGCVGRGVGFRKRIYAPYMPDDPEA